MADTETCAESEMAPVTPEKENSAGEETGKGHKRKRANQPKSSAKKKSKVEEPTVPPSEVPSNAPTESGVESTTAPDITTEESTEDETTEKEGANGVPLLDRPPEVSGTRIRKQVQRLNINKVSRTETPDRKKTEHMPGRGVKLGNSPRILAQWQSVKQSELTLLHRLLFKRPGAAHEIKKNLREFSGFPFVKEDKEFESRKHLLEKNTLNDLKFICQALCLEKSGTKETIVDRILDFCLCPNPSVDSPKTKSPKSGRKKNAKKSKTPRKDSSDKKTSRKSPKKEVKSSETVEDDGSSEEESSKEESNESQEENESSPAKTDETTSSGKEPDGNRVEPEAEGDKPGKDKDKPEKKSKATKRGSSKSGKAKTEGDSEEDEEEPPSKKVEKKGASTKEKTQAKKGSSGSKTKKSPKRQPKREIKVKLPPLKSKKRPAAIQSDSENEDSKKTAASPEPPSSPMEQDDVPVATEEAKDLIETTKPPEPAGTASKKTGKAAKSGSASAPKNLEQEQSSSEPGPSGKGESGEGATETPPETKSSPASKKPTDQELVATIKEILKTSNLEDLTMKNLCRKVYDAYPQSDLEKTRRDFIRSTAREILGGKV